VRFGRRFFGALACLLLGAGLSCWAQGGPLRATLPNGLRVVVVRDPLAPVAATVVNYLVGSNESPPGFPGMAHAQEHMMFRGSPGLSADQLAAIAAQMGGDFDADTQQTVTQYFFTVPSEDLEVALRVEAIRMSGVLDSEPLWAQERGAIEQEVARDLSNPEYVLFSRLMAEMFKGTVYEHDALGTRDSFDRTTAAMLKRFHDSWYAPNNAILVVAGDVEPPRVLELVKRLFGGIPARTFPPRPAVSLAPVEARTLSFTTDRPYGAAVIAFRLPGSRSPDYAASQILADALSSQRGDLYQLVVDGKALLAGFSLNGLPEASLGYALAAFPEGGDGAALASELRKLLSGIAARGVPADLVEAAKRQELAGAEFAKNSISDLAMGWSQILAVDGKQSIDEVTAAIRQVTVADVNRVASSFLNLDHAVSAIQTPQPSGAAVADKGFGGRESFRANPSGPVTLPDWAGAALTRLSAPPAGKQPSVTVLPNGLRLIVQPESISDTVSLYGRVRSNPLLQVPAGKEGLATLTDRMFAYGTSTLDRVAFQKALDAIAADVSAGSDFSLQVLSAHFERGAQLLADNLLHPAFPEPEFRILKEQLASEVAGELQSPDYRLSRAVAQALLPAHDPALRQSTPDTVRALTLGDLQDYYARVFRPDMAVIVIAGNVTPERAKKAVEADFGGWRAVGDKPEVVLPPVPLNKPATIAIPAPTRQQARVTMTQTLGLNRENPDGRALELGNRVLGGGFFASRLFRDLREKTGLVYEVSSTFDLGRTRSFYSIEFACDPANVAKARSIVEADLKQMQAEAVSPEELARAKSLALREIPLSEASVDGLALGLLDRAASGQPLDQPLRAAKAYLALQAEQVRAAFARWVRLPDFVQAVQGP
jgi:zinc protease